MTFMYKISLSVKEKQILEENHRLSKYADESDCLKAILLRTNQRDHFTSRAKYVS